MIDIRNLTFSYSNRTRVLHSISFNVEQGEFVGIVGPNGAGKSTLLRCISGTVRVDPGRVRTEGHDVTLLRRRELGRVMAVVPQEEVHAFGFTVQEVVSMGRYPHLGRFEFEKPSHRRVVEKAMGYTNTLHLRDKSVKALSGGEKQRVVIAKALAQEPKMLLLDEPTKNLDVRHTFDIMKLVSRMNRERDITVIGVFHDLNLAARFCKRIVLLKRGRILADGSPEEVLTSRNIKRAFEVDAVVEAGQPIKIEITG